MTTDLVKFLRERLADDERIANRTRQASQEWRNFDMDGELRDSANAGTVAYIPDVNDRTHIARHDPARVLAEVDAKRRMLAEHEPEWSMVEWPDDQNGDGFAFVCRSCGNRDLDGWRNWRPLVGDAGWFPEGVKPPYIVAPCTTLRLLALPYREHPDYQPDWAPEGA